MFVAAIIGFGSIKKSFFPSSTRPQFMVDVWLPQGTHIEETVRTSEDVQKYLSELEGATHVTTLAGAGGWSGTGEETASALVTYAVDSLLMNRPRSWDFYDLNLVGDAVRDQLDPRLRDALSSRSSR